MFDFLKDSFEVATLHDVSEIMKRKISGAAKEVEMPNLVRITFKCVNVFVDNKIPKYPGLIAPLQRNISAMNGWPMLSLEECLRSLKYEFFAICTYLMVVHFLQEIKKTTDFLINTAVLRYFFVVSCCHQINLTL